MPQQEDLQGHGMPWPLAESLGNDPQQVTAAGTTQATAASVKVNDYLVEMLGGNASNGVVLPSNAKIGTPYYVVNSNASNAGLVYVALNQYLNTTQNGSLTINAEKSAIFIQYKLNYWSSNLTA